MCAACVSSGPNRPSPSDDGGDVADTPQGDHARTGDSALPADADHAGGDGDGSEPNFGDSDENVTVVGTSCPDAPLPTQRAPDGTPLPPDVAALVKPALTALQTAMGSGERGQVSASVCVLREALGDWQGVAEAEARHLALEDPVPTPDRVQLAASFQQVASSSLFGSEAWVQNSGSTAGIDMREPLRVPCEMVDWYLVATDFAGAEADTFRSRAIAGLDWLLGVQSTSGAFPYPDLTDDLEAWLAGCAAQGMSEAECQASAPRSLALAKIGKDTWEALGRPADVLENGWFVNLDSIDPGGLQFDTGICGRTLLRGFRVTGDTRYLESAVAAGEWARNQIPVPNWNYNAFSVGLLADLGQLQPTAAWGEAALAKSRLGVLPGILEDGRWTDPHNARIVYHVIILRALLRLDQILDDPELSAAIALAFARFVGQVTANGAAAWSDGIETLVLASEQGHDPQQTLFMLVNAGARSGVVSSGGVVHWIAATP